VLTPLLPMRLLPRVVPAPVWLLAELTLAEAERLGLAGSMRKSGWHEQARSMSEDKPG
jgi:hypothetical protein